MLIFFIHGVTGRQTNYARPLQQALSKGLLVYNCPLAHYKAGFWGDVNNPSDDGTIQNYINADLHHLEKTTNSDANDLFRYQTIREDYIAPFVTDLASYLSPAKGRAIRQKLTNQLLEFAQDHPNEQDLHIICNSMGTIILWDSLFQTRYEPDDPAFQLRRKLGVGDRHSHKNPSTLHLKSITTMGSPILYVNTMLGIEPKTIRQFAQNSPTPLKWLNLIHASDIFAYPLRASLQMDDSWNLIFQDQFLKWGTTDDVLQRTARNLNLDIAAMALSTNNAHGNYWSDPQVSQLILSQQLVDQPLVQEQTASFEESFEDIKGHLQGLWQTASQIGQP